MAGAGRPHVGSSGIARIRGVGLAHGLRASDEGSSQAAEIAASVETARAVAGGDDPVRRIGDVRTMRGLRRTRTRGSPDRGVTLDPTVGDEHPQLPSQPRQYVFGTCVRYRGLAAGEWAPVERATRSMGTEAPDVGHNA
jgi:hypothetical protein